MTNTFQYINGESKYYTNGVDTGDTHLQNFRYEPYNPPIKKVTFSSEQCVLRLPLDVDYKNLKKQDWDEIKKDSQINKRKVGEDPLDALHEVRRLTKRSRIDNCVNVDSVWIVKHNKKTNAFKYINSQNPEKKSDWNIKFSNTHQKIYYVNYKLKKTQWNAPH
jgi:hypothetical protein